MRTSFILVMVLTLSACASAPNNKGVVTVNGTTYDDDNWNGR